MDQGALDRIIWVSLIMKHLFVDVKKILEHPGEEVEFSGPVELEPAKLGEEAIEFPLPSKMDVVLSSVSGGIVIKGKVLGRFRVRCGRCLEKFDSEKSIDIVEQAVVEGVGPVKDDVFPISDGKIDLAAIAYQNIIVEVPIQPLCRASCAGLCAVCGKNLNEEPHSHPSEEGDARLSALKDFFKKEQEK